MQNKPIEADFRYMPLFFRYSAFCMFYCQIMGQKDFFHVACGFLAFGLHACWQLKNMSATLNIVISIAQKH